MNMLTCWMNKRVMGQGGDMLPVLRRRALWMLLAGLAFASSCTQTVLVNTPRDEGDEPGECDDGVDNNLDGLVDCADEGCATADVCIDDDHDGWSDGGGDCDDNDSNTFPGADEVCDDKDNDCDGSVDEGFDTDEDGFTTCQGDCDDTDSGIFPGAEETCDGRDNDCDRETDEGFDGDGDGVTVCGGDCDDSDPDVHPGVVEACDGLDNDCDDLVDESFDQDGDGVVSCAGDCDDQDPATYPGAVEQCDGADNDCDGAADETTNDQDGDGFAAGPGGQPGTACRAVDGRWALVFSRGDCDDTDAAVHPGAVDAVGGVDADCGGTDGADPHVGFGPDSAPSIQAAIDAATDGQTIWVGPGTYLEHDVTFEGKPVVVASTHGPGSTILSAQWKGRVLVFDTGEAADTVLDGFTIRDGQGDYGGGAYFDDSSPTIRNCAISDNSAVRGAGVYVNLGSPTFRNVVFTGNEAEEDGGAAKLFSASPAFTNVTIVYNLAHLTGGGLSMYGASPAITNSIIAENWHQDLVVSGGSSPEIRYSVIHNDIGSAHDLETLDETVLEVSPAFLRSSNDRDSSNDDFHLPPGTSLIDAGDPDLTDPDGSRSDIGAYGGPEADFSYYSDTDGDGMYDGWELAHGLDPTVEDPDGDPDADGATNLVEFLGGSLPDDPDTDGDGEGDGIEYAQGSSPLDWYDRPGGGAPVAAQVPGDFGAVQDAIDAIRAGGTVVVSRTTVEESLIIGGKQVVLRPAEADTEPILSASGGTALTVLGGVLDLDRFIVEGGYSEGRGGGVTLIGAVATITNTTVRDNIAEYGGGLYCYQSDVVLEDIAVTANSAGFGGAFEAVESVVAVTSSTFQDNTASAFGGGLSLRASGISLQDVAVEQNRVVVPEGSAWSSPKAGGIYAYQTTLTATNLHVAGNDTEGEGGGLYLEDVDASLAGGDISSNDATSRGGGLYLYETTLELSNLAIGGNTSGDDGGGMAVVRGSVSTDTVAIADNTAADRGGGAYFYQHDLLAMTGGTVEGNQAGTDGGGLALDSAGETALASVALSSNEAAGDGGGLFLYGPGASTAFSDIEAENNIAGRDGGGLFLSYCVTSPPAIVRPSVSSNSASRNGGGVFITLYSSVDITDGTFDGNAAAGNGGAVGLEDHATVVFETTTVSGNTAGDDGGGLWASGASLTLSMVTLSSNDAGGDGGAICASSARALILDDVGMESNSAVGAGGGGHLSSSPDMVWENVSIEGNQADRGGGLSLEGAGTALEARNLDLEGNVAGTTGGGLVLADGSLDLAGGVFAGNSGPNGGAVSLESGTATWTNVVAVGNVANSGAAVLVWDAALAVVNGIAAYNEPANLIRVGAEAVTLQYSLFYNPDGSGVVGVVLDATNLQTEPAFLDYSSEGLPVDLHLSLASPAVNSGDPTVQDEDGSRSDLGMFGGSSGAAWDRDRDGFPDYFWPGSIHDGPPGLDPGDYDCDDLDREVYLCP